MNVTAAALVREGADRLSAHGVAEPWRDAERLLGHVLGTRSPRAPLTRKRRIDSGTWSGGAPPGSRSSI
jgi:PrmC N-terminal domain